MHALVIVAGTNIPSNSETLADAFIEGIRAEGGTTEKICLRTLTIEPFSLACYAPDAVPESDMQMLQEKILAADGLVIASPIWNFSVPAHLKNLIDRCGAFGLDPQTRSTGQLRGKPFFLIFTGGGPQAAWKGLLKRTTSSVSHALQYFGASPIGTHYEGKCTAGKGVFELVVDKRPQSLAALRERGRACAQIVTVYARTGRLPLRQTLLRRVYQVGQALQKKFM